MHSRPRVVVDPSGRKMDEIFSPEDKERLNEIVEVVWGQDEPMPEHLASEQLKDAMAVVCCGWRYGDIAGRYPRLRAIIDVSGGFPRGLDYDTCFARGIHVLSAAPGFGRQVAEMALGLALAASRDIPFGDRAMRAGEERWLHSGNADTFLLFDQPVGFIGYGSIARWLQALLGPFNCAISAYDPWLGDGYLRRHGVEPATLGTVMESSRVVFVLAAPSTENRALLSREMLERLRPGALLVLISRAHVVDFDALTELLIEGRIKAAIDVFPVEPLPRDHPVRHAEGAVLSAHRAGSVREGLWDIGQFVVDDLEVIAQGLPPRRLQAAAREFVRRVVEV